MGKKKEKRLPFLEDPEPAQAVWAISKLFRSARSAGPVTAVTARSKHKGYKNKAAVCLQTKHLHKLWFHTTFFFSL
jgi:hypothetical protein